MEAFKFGYKYYRRNMPMAIGAELLSFIGIFMDLMLPMMSEILIDFIIKDTPVTEKSGGIFHFLLTGQYGAPHTMTLFWNFSIIYTGMIVLRIIIIYTRDLMQEWTGLNLETDLRYATYEKLMKLDSQTLSDYNSGELLQIMNHDTIMFKELFCHRIPYFMDAIFILVTALVMIGTISWYYIIVPIIVVPFLVKTLMNFKKQAKENFKNIRAMQSTLNLTTTENISAVRIIRSFTNEELEEEKFAKANENFLNARLKQIWLSSKFDLTFNSIRQLTYISTIVIGAILVIRGHMTVGYILASSSYVMQLMDNITSINNHIFNMQQQTISLVEVQHFMEHESLVPNNEESTLTSCAPNIEMKNVSLRIDNQDILKNVNLSIPYGKKVGIVGETGSGKSVLLKTLVRIRDITDGEITVDGHDIKEYSLEHLRDMFSYVFQDVFLFSNTIESNIAYANPDATADQIAKAAENAQAAGFIEHFEDKYDTVIGERGIGISGGQKQRLSLARAFLKNAPIFVLDDSTSALDVNTERALLKEIRENYSDKTLIITAHRFSSVVDCDEIIYIRDGEIAERGTFEELMALGGSFAHVYNIQQEQQASVVDYDALARKEGEIDG